MDKKLIHKMIRNCFYQYNHDLGSVPLSTKEYDQLYETVMKTIEMDEDIDLNDVINDVVYEYLSE
ncbi:YqzH family protein [Cytobacillus sp. S13-E01]|uniref:YqzH family protein n=1 Tax=Cytobacillus sp. S13-E01 TaxID=3031326 RepID=UPI0023D7D196|nr:YqzH family protein [Cytobacillus sp. S13-E01]MDF0726116.1 YqzH family protein [Cytobacillus sp. S13-E01]